MASQAILIDLDGTLWDSAPWYAEIIAGDDPARRDQLAVAFSTPNGANKPVAALLRDAGFTDRSFEAACEQHCDGLHVYDGARETITKISRQVVLGVVTSLPRWIAAPMLEGTELAHLFATLQCARRHVPPKPNPAGLNHALADLGVTPQKSIYVGDSAADHLASTAAGMGFYWASWGYGDPPADCPPLDNWTDLEACR